MDISLKNLLHGAGTSLVEFIITRKEAEGPYCVHNGPPQDLIRSQYNSLPTIYD